VLEARFRAEAELLTDVQQRLAVVSRETDTRTFTEIETAKDVDALERRPQLKAALNRAAAYSKTSPSSGHRPKPALHRSMNRQAFVSRAVGGGVATNLDSVPNRAYCVR
jgi:hypothetical protein